MIGAHPHIAALAADIWALGNGILHDAFAPVRHKDGYDRDLLRLLMDGHILITCGAASVLAYFLLKQGHALGAWLCLLCALNLIAYCAMIFPFLKSFGTMAINTVMLVLAVLSISGRI